ncbi:MAG: alpha/beta hydrolase [Ilumatobacteraceae bacterium]
MSTLHRYELGDPAGPPLLAVHGITAHGLRFRRLAEECWPTRRTVAVDLRGHGRSTSDGPWSIQQHVTDLLDTLDALALDRVDVVGHSYGGNIGVQLLATAPQRVRRLVLLDPALAQPGSSASEAAMDTIEDAGWASVNEATDARNRGLTADGSINPAVPVEIAEHLTLGDDGRYRFRYHRPTVVTAWGEVCYPLPIALERRPTLLVVAERAGLVSDDVVVGLDAMLGDDLHVVRLDCGHMLYWEAFDETAAAIDAFLTGTE